MNLLVTCMTMFTWSVMLLQSHGHDAPSLWLTDLLQYYLQMQLFDRGRPKMFAAISVCMVEFKVNFCSRKKFGMFLSACD